MLASHPRKGTGYLLSRLYRKSPAFSRELFTKTEIDICNFFYFDRRKILLITRPKVQDSFL